jgi:hypothetical protein
MTWPDPVSLIADVITIFGIPVLAASTVSLVREAKKAREIQNVSHGCLEFYDVELKCAINLVPLKEITAVPRPGDDVSLPGEKHDSKRYGAGSYKVLKVDFTYLEAPEIDQPCPALPAKIIVYVQEIA